MVRQFYCQHGPAAAGDKNNVSSLSVWLPLLQSIWGWGAQDDAASGAAGSVATEVRAAASPGPVSITQLLEMNTRQGPSTDAYLQHGPLR